MALIDVNALREYLTDYCGTAAFNGFPAAILDTWDIESASEKELCQKAEELKVDLSRFIVRDDS